MKQTHVRGLCPHLCGLVLELRHPLSLAIAGQAPQNPAELSVLRDVGLEENSGLRGWIPAASS